MGLLSRGQVHRKSWFLSCKSSKAFSQNCMQQTTELRELAMYCATKFLNIASHSLRVNSWNNVYLTLQQYFALTRKSCLKMFPCQGEQWHNVLKTSQRIWNNSLKTRDFTYFSLALDESSDAHDTAQLLIFLRGITPDFEITEELASVQSMKSTITIFIGGG